MSSYLDSLLFAWLLEMLVLTLSGEIAEFGTEIARVGNNEVNTSLADLIVFPYYLHYPTTFLPTTCHFSTENSVTCNSLETGSSAVLEGSYPYIMSLTRYELLSQEENTESEDV